MARRTTPAPLLGCCSVAAAVFYSGHPSISLSHSILQYHSILEIVSSSFLPSLPLFRAHFTLFLICSFSPSHVLNHRLLPLLISKNCCHHLAYLSLSLSRKCFEKATGPHFRGPNLSSIYLLTLHLSLLIFLPLSDECPTCARMKRKEREVSLVPTEKSRENKSFCCRRPSDRRLNICSLSLL